MTIDEAIKQLETYTIPCGKYKVAYDLAVETLRKYQKIEQILEERESDGGAFEMSESYWLKMIKEVVKDGRN